MPSLAQRALNYATDTAQHLAAGCPETPPAELARRLALCERCPGNYFDGTHCRACGCGVKDKAVRALSRCPHDYWSVPHGPLEFAASPVRFDERSLSPLYGGKRFNSSLTPYGDGYALAYRDGWRGSRVHVATLDRDFRPTAFHLLRLKHADAHYGREDPRLFWFAGRMHVAFIGVADRGKGFHTNQLYARLSGADSGFRVEAIHHPHYAGRLTWEKNWQFFEHDGSLYVVYSIAPHRVLRITGDTAELIHETPWRSPWQGGEMRGGASPVLVGDEFFCWFHSRTEQADGHRVYELGLYTFDARPPFRVRRVTLTPLRVADRETKPPDQYASVVFPCGAVLADGRWLVSLGIHDRWTEIWTFDAAAVNQRLVPLRWT